MAGIPRLTPTLDTTHAGAYTILYIRKGWEREEYTPSEAQRAGEGGSRRQAQEWNGPGSRTTRVPIHREVGAAGGAPLQAQVFVRISGPTL